MDDNRFDALSRTIATRSSRRHALRRFGAGGIGVSLLGLAGVRNVVAQDDDDEKTCNLTLAATIASGPGKDVVYQGDLTMVIGPEGAIDDGSLKTPDGD